MTEPRRWQDIDPKDAVNLNLATDLSITAPLNEMGERCPWPWEPQQLKGVPMGQYHCSYCGCMCVAGIEHPDYTGFDDDYEEYIRNNPDKGELPMNWGIEDDLTDPSDEGPVHRR